MTDLTDDALDKLVARLTWAAGIDQAEYPFPLCDEAAAVITALRQREATAVAGAIEAAAQLCEKLGEGWDDEYGCRVYPSAEYCAAALRTLRTDATRAALDRAKAEGMREAANVKRPDMSRRYCTNDETFFNEGFKAAIDAILAAADKLEGK